MSFLPLSPAEIYSRLLHAFQVFESWTVHIAFAIGMVLLFPGLLYVLYDCLLYVVRSLVYSGATAVRQPAPAPVRGVGRSPAVDSSDDDDDQEGVEVKVKDL